MLSKVIIKNFKSIESLTLDLSFAEKKAPARYLELDIFSFLEPTKKIKDRTVSVMNIYGANASGKSNIIHSLFCFHRLLISGVNAIPQDIFSVNKLRNLGNETSISLDFFLQNKKYTYLLEYNNKYITKELLQMGESELFSIENSKGSFEKITARNFNKNAINDVFKISCLAPSEDKKIQINPFLSSSIAKLPGLNHHLNDVFNFFQKDLFISLGNDIPAGFSIDQLANSNSQEDIDDAFTQISDFIKKLDIDIERFEYKRDIHSLNDFKTGNNKYNIPNIANKSWKIDTEKNIILFNEITSIHTTKEGKEIIFRFDEESTGTRLSFGLAGQVLKTLKKGGVMIIDELDRSLHPLLLKSLIRVFKDKDYNIHNAQLICTLHTTDILEDSIYKISEFSFINKNPKRGSFLKRLSDFEGIRNEMNFRDRYLNGLYAGIPHPYN